MTHAHAEAVKNTKTVTDRDYNKQTVAFIWKATVCSMRHLIQHISNMNFSFRKATVNDCSLIRELASKIWGPTYQSILSEEQLNYMFEMMYSTEHIKQQMSESGHQYFIVFADEKPAGYLSIEKVSDNQYIFQKIYTLPELHGKGIGRYLFEQGVSYLKTICPSPFTVELFVNRENPAVGFYEHLGMKKTATRDHDIGNGYFMNDYVMAIEVK